MSKKQKKVTPKGTKVTKEFSFKLTDKEFEEYGKKAAALNGEVFTLNSEFEQVKDDWKAKISAKASQCADLLAIIRNEKENRTVEATLVKNYDEKTIEYYFDGKIIESRTMTQSECQVEADFAKSKDKTDYKKVGANAKAVRQKLQKDDAKTPEVLSKDEDIANVHRMETSRFSKTSAVDGPTRA